MTREEIIQGLQFTIDMFLSDPLTGEPITKPRNDIDKTTIDACKGAIEELQDNSYELWKESYEVEHERNMRLEEKIKALEQEPCEDAISRQAVLDAIAANCIWENEYNLTSSRIKKAVEGLSPVTPQPKTGQWVLLDECSNSGYYCSECHKKLVKEGWSDTVKKIKYCPNCGSLMKMGNEGKE